MEKIDFVITWVDGGDHNWQEQRTKYSNESIRTQQYRDWDILKYWFRGVEKYAPWVNKIYFVTEGHLPSFLNVDHKKLAVVKHSDYIPEEYLPVFSSHPIELNLHRIKGLSDNFVYFNDDTFINSNVEMNDFFDGVKPRDFAIINPIVPSYYNSVSNIMINNISLINSKYKKRQVMKKNIFKWYNFKYGGLNLLNLINTPWSRFAGLYQNHLPSSFNKSTFDLAWKIFEAELHATSQHRVRNNFTDVNQWLLKELQVVEGNFSPQRLNIGKYVMVDGVDKARVVESVLSKEKAKLICINDHCNDLEFEQSKDIITKALSKKFPMQSSFEK